AGDAEISRASEHRPGDAGAGVQAGSLSDANGGQSGAAVRCAFAAAAGRPRRPATGESAVLLSRGRRAGAQPGGIPADAFELLRARAGDDLRPRHRVSQLRPGPRLELQIAWCVDARLPWWRRASDR